MRPLKSAIDLFSGAGGLSLGLHMAGWEVLLAVELDKDAAKTYRANFSQTTLLEKNIQDIDFTPYRGQITLVAGGPPCQPFSVAGNQLAEDDPRDCVPAFIRVLREVEPLYFLMENVPGLLTSKHQLYIKRMLRNMRDAGYCVSYQRLNAADYGVPQYRERVFFVGIHHSIKKDFCFPLPTHGKGRDFPHMTAREALANVPKDEPNRAKVTYCKNPVLRPSPWAGMLLNGGGRPINPEEPCQTIPATAGGNRTPLLDPEGLLLQYHRELLSGGQIRVGEVEGARRLTLRECARIQSFPDDFHFSGAKSARYRQVGNAIPPLLAKAMGDALMRCVEEKEDISSNKKAGAFQDELDLVRDLPLFENILY
jgi:DNA (cytosine-5)-methyltransferase 1